MAQAPLQCYQGVPTSAGPATDCSRFVNTFCDAAAAVPAVSQHFPLKLPGHFLMFSSRYALTIQSVVASIYQMPKFVSMHDIPQCIRYCMTYIGDFIAWNTFTRNVPPSAANCKSVLNKVISQCVLVKFMRSNYRCRSWLTTNLGRLWTGWGQCVYFHGWRQPWTVWPWCPWRILGEIGSIQHIDSWRIARPWISIKCGKNCTNVKECIRTEYESWFRIVCAGELSPINYHFQLPVKKTWL